MSFANVNTDDVMNDLNGGNDAPVEQATTEIPQQAMASPVEETLYEVKVNGQTIKVPITELTQGYSRQQDYTRKTTELAEQRRQIENELNTYRQQVDEVRRFFAHPQVQQALQGLRGPQVDPNQPLTAQQAQQLFESQLTHAQQQQQQQMAQMAYELEVRNLAAGFSREIESTLQQILTKHPVLADVEGIDQILRARVSQRQPQSLDETKQAFYEVAQQAAAKLEARFAQQQKQQAVQQTQFKRNGIEPPGGTTAVPPAPAKLRIGSPEMHAAAVADLLGNSQG